MSKYAWILLLALGACCGPEVGCGGMEPASGEVTLGTCGTPTPTPNEAPRAPDAGF
jgi:hypothetical protein